MKSRLKSIARPLFYSMIAKASSSYVSGDKLDDALRTSDKLLEKGYSLTLAYWNQYADAVDDVVALYQEIINELAKNPTNNYISIKGPAFNFDPDLYKALIVQARESRIPLHFDSLGHEVADAMYTLIEDNTPEHFGDIGCTLPGRWQRSLEDAEKVNSLGMVGRVVKGQWEDPTHPNIDPRTGFLSVVRQLAGKSKIVRVATHDAELAKESLKLLQDAGTCGELELLYGLPVVDVLKAVKPLNVPIRIYVPFGHAWIPYALNNVRKNPKVLWWLLKDSFSGSYIKRFPKLAGKA